MISPRNIFHFIKKNIFLIFNLSIRKETLIHNPIINLLVAMLNIPPRTISFIISLEIQQNKRKTKSSHSLKINSSSKINPRNEKIYIWFFTDIFSSIHFSTNMISHLNTPATDTLNVFGKPFDNRDVSSDSLHILSGRRIVPHWF